MRPRDIWLISFIHYILFTFDIIKGKPTTVFFHVTVMSLDSIDESSMVSYKEWIYSLSLFLSGQQQHQTWDILRLKTAYIV